jgi:enoyl-CoA hydratase/carnithine racemase
VKRTDAPLLLTGADGTFSAGLNLKEVASLDVPGMTRFLQCSMR